MFFLSSIFGKISSLFFFLMWVFPTTSYDYIPHVFGETSDEIDEAPVGMLSRLLQVFFSLKGIQQDTRTWQWKHNHLKMYMVNFHGHESW